MHEVKPPDSSANQIPWAKKTKVVSHVLDWKKEGNDRIELQTEKPWALATIYYRGSLEVQIDSQELIGDYLKKSNALTRSLREYLRITQGTSFTEEVKHWLAGNEPEPPDVPEVPGVLDWEPPAKPRKWKRLGTLGDFGSGISGNVVTDYWIGSDFPFVHALFFEPNWPEEGIAVNWGGDAAKEAEVWLGDVGDFLYANEARFESPEDYLDWNARFENGWIWALYEMGVFARGDVPEWAVDVITADPDVMTREIVEQLVPQLASLKPELRTGVLQWLENRQEEHDRAVGQLRIWPRREDA